MACLVIPHDVCVCVCDSEAVLHACIVREAVCFLCAVCVGPRR